MHLQIGKYKEIGLSLLHLIRLKRNQFKFMRPNV